MTNFFPRVVAAVETLRKDATRRKEAEERESAANLPKPAKSRAQMYLDGDAVSVPLSFEIARDCVRLEAENARLRQALSEMGGGARLVDLARMSFDGDDISRAELHRLCKNGREALGTKGGDNGE